MYHLKNVIKTKMTQTEIAKNVGIDISTLSRILNQKQDCSKAIAYYITKTINENAEIEDYFERVK